MLRPVVSLQDPWWGTANANAVNIAAHAMRVGVDTTEVPVYLRAI